VDPWLTDARQGASTVEGRARTQAGLIAVHARAALAEANVTALPESNRRELNRTL
jgi:hypothetical protein